MKCPMSTDSNGTMEYCKNERCAWWIIDKDCCAIKAIALSSIANLPNCKSKKVNITDISPNHTTTNINGIESYDYVFSFPGGDQ